MAAVLGKSGEGQKRAEFSMEACLSGHASLRVPMQWLSIPLSQSMLYLLVLDFLSSYWSTFHLLMVPRLCRCRSNHLSRPRHTGCLKQEYTLIVVVSVCRGKPSISELYKERRRAYNRKSKKIEPDIWDRIEWKPPRWQRNPYVWVAFTLWLTLIAVSMAFGD